MVADPALSAPRPPARQPVAVQGELLAALDIGGTKIAGAVVDRAGAVLQRVQAATPAGGDREVLAAVHAVLDGLAAGPLWDRVAALGIGSAGPVDIANGTVSPVNIPAWRGFPLVDEVRGHAAVGALPVVLCGDAVAMTAAEHWIGAARGSRDALCMVVSTGVGAGLVLDGAVRSGPTGNAGHLGHITVAMRGDGCACGSRGCVEQFASGTAITRRALAGGWRPADGAAPDAAGVAAAARAGDAAAQDAFDTAARALAAAIAAVATLVEIELAVIGGGVAEAHDILFPAIRHHLPAYATLSFASTVHIHPATLRADAGLIGAAALARTTLTNPAAPRAI